jgi:hypothetical protein
MGDFIRNVNEADTLARLYRQSVIDADKLTEELVNRGWYNISIEGRNVYASTSAVTIELGRN